MSTNHTEPSGEYGKWAFWFKPGTVNGREKMFVQIVVKDAVFCVLEQGWFDPYAFKFKYPHWNEIPSGLASAIDHAFKSTFSPERKFVNA